MSWLHEAGISLRLHKNCAGALNRLTQGLLLTFILSFSTSCLSFIELKFLGVIFEISCRYDVGWFLSYIREAAIGCIFLHNVFVSPASSFHHVPNVRSRAKCENRGIKIRNPYSLLYLVCGTFTVRTAYILL